MRPAEYTDEEIVAAGESIRATGRNVTGFALRQKVGGGNPSRLRQVWEEHLAGEQHAQADPVAELPAEVAETITHISQALTERIATLATELNDKAVKAAERRVAELVKAAGEQRTQTERELADAAETVEQYEIALDKMTEERDHLQSQLGSTLADLQSREVELAQLKERLAATENALQEHRKDAAKEAQRCAEKILVLKTARDELDKEAVAQRDNCSRLTGQLETLETQNQHLLEALRSEIGKSV
jgi:chromosome segregation ATPase